MFNQQGTNLSEYALATPHGETLRVCSIAKIRHKTLISGLISSNQCSLRSIIARGKNIEMNRAEAKFYISHFSNVQPISISNNKFIKTAFRIEIFDDQQKCNLKIFKIDFSSNANPKINLSRNKGLKTQSFTPLILIYTNPRFFHHSSLIEEKNNKLEVQTRYNNVARALSPHNG